MLGGAADLWLCVRAPDRRRHLADVLVPVAHRLRVQWFNRGCGLATEPARPHFWGGVQQAARQPVGVSDEVAAACPRLQYHFNQPLDGIGSALSLEQLTFHLCFYQSIDGVEWPATLLQLTFARDLNQPVGSIKSAKSLEQLSFGECFNQPIAEVAWPASLQHVKFHDAFNQSIELVTWPYSLERLTFGRSFQLPEGDFEWPPSLQQLTIARPPEHPPLPTWRGVYVCRVLKLETWVELWLRAQLKGYLFTLRCFRFLSLGEGDCGGGRRYPLGSRRPVR